MVGQWYGEEIQFDQSGAKKSALPHPNSPRLPQNPDCAPHTAPQLNRTELGSKNDNHYRERGGREVSGVGPEEALHLSGGTAEGRREGGPRAVAARDPWRPGTALQNI